MAITISKVPDSQFYLGPSVQGEFITIAPGTADYVTGGYVLGAGGVAVPSLVNFFGANVIGQNAAAAALGYVPIFKVVQTNNPAKASVLTLTFMLFGVVGATAGLTEAAAAASFVGSVWTAVIFGY